MFETEALQISANFKQSIWYTNLLWDEFRYPANDTCDVHYVQISIKYYIWSLLCFSGKETKRISEFRTHSTQLLSGLPLPHRIYNRPSQAARALLHTVHLPGNYTYNFHLLPPQLSSRKTAGRRLGSVSCSSEVSRTAVCGAAAEVPAGETSFVRNFCSSLHKRESSHPARCTGTAHKQIV